MRMENATILVVEDEFITGADLQSKLKKMGYNVPRVVDTGQKAIDSATELKPDLVLMDITLKEEMTGIQAAEVIGRKQGIPVVFLTAHSDENTVDKAVKAVPFGYLIKPLDERALKTTIQMALYKNEIDGKVRERDTIIQALINANPDPMFLIDQNTNILVYNQGIASRLPPIVSADGITLAVLEAGGFVSPRLTAAIREHFFDPRPFRFEEEYNGKWISYTLTPLQNMQGRVDRCAVDSHDVTAIKRAEQTAKALSVRLEKEKQNLLMFEAMMNSMDDFIIGTDDMGVISFVNEAFIQRFGFTLNEVKNKHISILQAPGDLFAIDANAFLVDKKRVWNGNFTGINKFGLKIKTLLKSSPVIHDNQTFSRVFVLREKLS